MPTPSPSDLHLARVALERMRAAAEDDGEACLDCAAESANADEFSHSAPGELYADMAAALSDALDQLGARGRVDVAWSVRAHRLLDAFKASRASAADAA